jgi:hypothetical protein
MRQLLLTIITLSFICGATAQMGTSGFSAQSNVLYNDGYGIPWKFDFEMSMVGSPFFDTGYQIGSLKIMHGKDYHQLKLKINLESNKVIFEGKNGEMLSVSRPVERVSLQGKDGKESIFRAGFNSIDKQNDQSLYQVLDSGKVLLLKYVEIRFKDARSAYSGTDLTRTYRQIPTYYIWTAADGLIRAPSHEAGLMAIFPAHKNAIAAELRKDKLKLKKEEDLTKAIQFCNSLKE